MYENQKPGTPSDHVNISDLIDQGRWSLFQKLVLGLVSLAYLTDGIANQSLGLAIPALMRDWNLPREAFASVAAIGLLGLTLGAVAGGMLGDKFGRRALLIASAGFFGVMTMAQSWATGTGDLMALRFLDGIGIGAMIPNGASMISEFTARRNRPFALAIGLTFIPLGSMLAGLIGAAMLEPHGWQGLFLVLGGITLIVACLLAAIPESPIFLANSGTGQTKLRDIAQRCGWEPGSRMLVASHAGGSGNRMPLGELFTRDLASSTLCLWIGFFFCLLATYAMFSWIPAMLASLGFPLSTTGLGMTALSLGGVVGGVVGGWTIRQFGSRGTVLGFGAASFVLALLLGLIIQNGTQNLPILLGFLVAIGFFAAGLANGLYTFAAFIYPDRARGTGIGVAAAVGRVGAIASSYAGVLALELGGASSYFILVAGCLAISAGAVALIRKQIPRSA